MVARDLVQVSPARRLELRRAREGATCARVQKSHVGGGDGGTFLVVLVVFRLVSRQRSTQPQRLHDISLYDVCQGRNLTHEVQKHRQPSARETSRDAGPRLRQHAQDRAHCFVGFFSFARVRQHFRRDSMVLPQRLCGL